MLPFGYFANVIRLTSETGLAISTDGAGTKVLVAQMVGRYDTIGIDCIAMNVNDLLCVGAEPITMVDYLAVERLDPDHLAQIAQGARRGRPPGADHHPGAARSRRCATSSRAPGARAAPASTSPAPPWARCRSTGSSSGSTSSPTTWSSAFAAPACTATVSRSPGVCSRSIGRTRYLQELGRTLGEELLTPTKIYVREILDVLASGIDVKALIHITSDGLLNCLARREPGDRLRDPLRASRAPADLPRHRARGQCTRHEMYRVYNMGIGFCLVVSHRGDHASRTPSRS